MSIVTFSLTFAQISVTWYLLPLALVISLVYSASRYELPERILRKAGRLFITIMVFMSVFFAILWIFSKDQ